MRARAEAARARGAEEARSGPRSRSPTAALDNVVVGAAVGERDLGPLRALFATPRARAASARARNRALESLERVGLAWAADVPAAELRAADQRALMIAAALAARPRVLLVDEPSAGIGAEEVDGLLTLLGGLRDDGIAVLLVEHNLRVVRNADHVVVLAAGRVVAGRRPRARLGRSGSPSRLPRRRSALRFRRALSSCSSSCRPSWPA